MVREAALPRRWKRRGGFTDLAGLDDTALLARAFRIPAAGLAEAPLHYLGATGAEPGGYCLYAYPVHLHARREQLVLMAGEDFQPSDNEADSLIELIAGHFSDWRIERTADGMWFIMPDTAPDLETTPLQAVLGEDINDHLPRGGDGMAWVSRLNEVQMILFDAEVNRAREAAGAPPVNGLWVWGGGSLPEIAAPEWRRVATNDPVARGIARRTGLATEWRETPPARTRDAEIGTDGTLWIWSRPGADAAGPVVSQVQWETLCGRLKRGELGRLVLLEPGYGELSVDARLAASWWPW